MLRSLNEQENLVESFPVSADALAKLLKMVGDGKLDTSRAKDVFQQMVRIGRFPEAAMQQLGIEKVGDDQLVALCRELLEQNPKVIQDVQNGKKQAIGALIGQARKRNPESNPGAYGKSVQT